jgi:hypothetical protein
MRIPVALLVLLSFGCATVRVPAGSVEGPPPDLGDVAEPKVELWLEGGSAASASETAEAQKAARDALAIAISQRRPDVSALGAEDPVVVVRERAVTRTPARRREQVAAKVGMVVGIVAVAAAAVFVALTSKGGGGSKAAPAAKAPAGAAKAAAAPAAKAAAPAATAAATPVAKAAPARAPGHPRSGPVARPAPAPAPQTVPGGKPTPARPVFAPGPPPPVWYPAARPGGFIFWETSVAFHAPVPFDSDLASDGEALLPSGPPPDEMADDLEPMPPPLPPLPEMEKLPLDQRGFFDGDQTLLEVDVVDRATGTVLWTRRVKSGADPRDRAEVARLLDEALADLPR